MKNHILIILTLSLFYSTASALEPEEVLVVANMNAAKSQGIAKYYMDLRKIPRKNLVLLFMHNSEK